MKEKYSNVCKKIIEHYSKFLTEKEIIALKKIIKLDNYDNLNIIFINKTIDRIWQMTLTKPTNFKQGEPFAFLVINYMPLNYLTVDRLSEVNKLTSYSLNLITDDKIINNHVRKTGIIVEIDYINAFSEPLLPIDFQEKEVSAKVKLNIVGIYNISLGLNDYDPDEGLSNDFAEITNNFKVNINKAIYNFKKNNIILDERDKKFIANTIVFLYMIDNNIHKIEKLRDYLKKVYKKRIFKEYTKYFNQEITLDDFLNTIYSLLDNDIEVQQIDKML